MIICMYNKIDQDTVGVWGSTILQPGSCVSGEVCSSGAGVLYVCCINGDVMKVERINWVILKL